MQALSQETLPTEPPSFSDSPYSSGEPRPRCLWSLLLILGGVASTVDLGTPGFRAATVTRCIILFAGLAMAIFDLTCATSHAVSAWLLLPLCYAVSHLGRVAAIFSLQRLWKKWERLLDENNPEFFDAVGRMLLDRGERSQLDFHLAIPRRRIVSGLIVCACLRLVGTAIAAIADYEFRVYFPAGLYKLHIGIIVLIVVGYCVAHVSFICCLLVAFAAVEGALARVRQAAQKIHGRSSRDWSLVNAEYIGLRRRLRSHCSFAQTPVLLAFATLTISSFSNATYSWVISHSAYPPIATMAQFMNFVIWTSLLVVLALDLVSVHEEVERCFANEIERLCEARCLSVVDVADNSNQMVHPSQLIQTLSLISAKPAGWILIPGVLCTRGPVFRGLSPLFLSGIAQVCVYIVKAI